jgi:hypothetical protein
MEFNSEANELRRLFKEKYPDINVIDQCKLHKLIYLLDEEFVEHAKNSEFQIFMEPMNNLVAKMIRKKGLSYKGLDLKCCSFYFSGRQAVTFTKEGEVYFCGWTGGNNYIPFLKAFRRWLEN